MVPQHGFPEKKWNGATMPRCRNPRALSCEFCPRGWSHGSLYSWGISDSIVVRGYSILLASETLPSRYPSSSPSSPATSAIPWMFRIRSASAPTTRLCVTSSVGRAKKQRSDVMNSSSAMKRTQARLGVQKPHRESSQPQKEADNSQPPFSHYGKNGIALPHID